MSKKELYAAIRAQVARLEEAVRGHQDEVTLQQTVVLGPGAMDLREDLADFVVEERKALVRLLDAYLLEE